MKTVDYLRKAIRKIDAPEKWCKGGFARTREGQLTYDFKCASQYSLVGAMYAVREEEEVSGEGVNVRSFSDAMLLLRKSIPGTYGEVPNGATPMSLYNDSEKTTYDDVVIALTKAICAARELDSNLENKGPEKRPPLHLRRRVRTKVAQPGCNRLGGVFL